MRNDEKTLTEIGERFGAQIAALVNRGILFTATVNSVENGYAKVSRFDGDEPIRVALKLLNADNADVQLTPEIGSLVIVANADGNINTPFVVAFERLSEVKVVRDDTEILSVSENNIALKIGDTSVEITDNELRFNGGKLGGIVVPSDLTSRLNKIENDINTLKSIFASWIPVPSDGGAVLKTATATWASSRLSMSKDSDYENSKILQ